jgi:hypothetical protein
MAFKKKLHLPPPVALDIETHRTKRTVRIERTDSAGLERAVRQRLADKINGNLLGLWLLLPEHLRLGTWDLLQSWTGKSPADLHPRLALQLIHESVLCVHGLREKRTLSQRGFELLNGLPYVATDTAIHQLLEAHTVQQAHRLQLALGQIRYTFGHFNGQLLVLDPHRMPSHSQRQMLRLQKNPRQQPCKMAQTFFCLDADTAQPLCFTSASSARSVSHASPELLDLCAQILAPLSLRPFVMADTEHHTVELFRWMRQSPFDFLVPMPMSRYAQAALSALPPEQFQPHWPGYATLKQPFRFAADPTGSYYQFVQRCGQRPDQWQFKSFLSTADRNELQALSEQYPQRWHIEQFFDNDQALGWEHAGTMNLHIRYGRMTLALFAQAASYMLRQRLPAALREWDAPHLAKDFFRALEGDLRVCQDTILITLYNCPHAEEFKRHYEKLPNKLIDEGVNPSIPWLYNFKLDFRFK